jgi:hypothetical protein
VRALLISPGFVLLKNAMERKTQARLASLPRTRASFIEPMECLSVSKLPEGARRGFGKLISSQVAGAEFN